MLECRPVTVAKIRAQGTDLFAEYAAECAFERMRVPNPQWATYEMMERGGFWYGVGAFDGDALVGFASVIVNVLPHFGVLAATAESVFVTKSARNTGAWTKLRAAVRREAKSRGCAELFLSAVAGSQLEKVLGKRLPRTNSVFCETLR